jgi:hypothetical protein
VSPGRFRGLKGWAKGESLNGELAAGSSLTGLPPTDSEPYPMEVGLTLLPLLVVVESLGPGIIGGGDGEGARGGAPSPDPVVMRWTLQLLEVVAALAGAVVDGGGGVDWEGRGGVLAPDPTVLGSDLQLLALGAVAALLGDGDRGSAVRLGAWDVA